MTTFFRFYWLMVVLIVMVSMFPTALCAQGDRATTATMSVASPSNILVSTQSLGGGALEGVALRVTLPDGTALEVVSNQIGQATIALDQQVDPKKVEIELVTEDYHLAGSRWIKSRVKGNLMYFLMLYPSDSSTMSLEEKVALIGALPRIYQIRRLGDWEATTDGQKTLLRTSGLLMASRGSLEPWAYERTPESEAVQLSAFEDSLGPDPTPTVLVTVVDSYGNARGGRVVELFSLNSDNKAFLAGRGRTDRDGTIYFRNLELEGLYRVLCPAENDNLSAKSSFIKLTKAGVKNAGTLVLRESGVSGIVTSKEAPLPMAKVMVMRDGRPLLTTKTDEFGYFSLGPISGSGVDLAIESAGVVEKVMVPVSVTNEDLMIPFDLFQTVKKQPTQ
jgi:hypothetical protein